jgi:hypothetical protein
VSKKKMVLCMTELGNAADFLDRTLDFLEEIPKNKSAWKWVFISIHGALYGFLICSLQQTSFLEVIERGKDETLDDLRWSLATRQEPLKPIGLHQAVRLCQDRGLLTLTAQQEEAVTFLADGLRNPFEDYIPGGWSIYLAEVPRICRQVMEVTCGLMHSTSGVKLRWPSQNKGRKALARGLKSIRLLKKIEKEYKKLAND